jgi:hypothetical protein
MFSIRERRRDCSCGKIGFGRVAVVSAKGRCIVEQLDVIEFSY